MGNDLDVCSKDEQLIQFYEEQYGPQNESVFQLVYRTYNKFCDTLINPPPINYTAADLRPKFFKEEDNDLWKIREFDLLSLGNRIHCCYWRYDGEKEVGNEPSSRTPPSDKNRLCIVYLPTNQRALNEAVEVLPLARQLKCDVFSFDYAGCGKSDGSMHERIDIDIENVLMFIQATLGENSLRMVLWARGMSTALVIMFLSRLTKQQLQYHKWKRDTAKATATINEAAPKKSRWPFSRRSSTPKTAPTTPADFATPDSLLPGLTAEEIEQDIKQRLQILQFIKCIVLDSPFISVEDMIRSGIEKMHSKGYLVTKSIIYFVIKMIMKNISKRLNGFNVFSVKPIEHITSINYFPCCILSADNDDYIPTQHGEKISKLWKNDSYQETVGSDSSDNVSGGNGNIYGNIQWNIIQGRHFNRRSEEIIELTYDFIKSHILHFNNTRFDNLDSILALEEQLREQEENYLKQAKEMNKSIDGEENISLKQLEQEVIQELRSAIDQLGSSSANATEASERKEDEGDVAIAFEESLLLVQEEHFNTNSSVEKEQIVIEQTSETVELIEIDEMDANKEAEQATPLVNDDQVSSPLSSRSLSFTHLRQPVFDSKALKWSQNETISKIRSDDHQEKEEHK